MSLVKESGNGTKRPVFQIQNYLQGYFYPSIQAES